MTELSPIPQRESARPAAARGPYDGVFDIVCVGAGAGGLATALFSRWLGNSVLILRYMARLSRPECYDPAAPHLGMPAWEYAMFEAI